MFFLLLKVGFVAMLEHGNGMPPVLAVLDRRGMPAFYPGLAGMTGRAQRL